jgi:hypothetical protein
MKNKKSFWGLMALVLAFGVIAMGCDDGKGDDGDNTNTDLRLFSVTADGPYFSPATTEKKMTYGELYAFATSYGIENSSVTLTNGETAKLFPWITELEVGLAKKITWTNGSFLKVNRTR